MFRILLCVGLQFWLKLLYFSCNNLRTCIFYTRKLYEITISTIELKLMSVHHKLHCTLYSSKKKLAHRKISDKNLFHLAPIRNTYGQQLELPITTVSRIE